jgi:hypothetical protein
MGKAIGVLQVFPSPCSLTFGITKGHLTLLLRSPWSNEYDPPLDDGTIPTPKLRKLEIAANEAFDTYREMCVVSAPNHELFDIDRH